LTTIHGSFNGTMPLMSIPVENSPFCRSKNAPRGGGDGLQVQPVA
jgi:hypothetical protein